MRAVTNLFTNLVYNYLLGDEAYKLSDKDRTIVKKTIIEDNILEPVGIDKPYYISLYNQYYYDVMLSLLSKEPYNSFDMDVEVEYLDWFFNEIKGSSLINLENGSLIGSLFSRFCKQYFYEELNKDKPVDVTWLKDWLISWRLKYDNRLYPELFKKICYYYMLKYSADTAFLEDVGIRTQQDIINNTGKNLPNKWNLYSSYRKQAIKHTYNTLPIKRKGVKREYLTRFIQEVYYEAHRQIVNSNTHSLESITSFKELKADKGKLPIFVDVFAGSGTVAASINVDSNKKVINEFDKGVLDAIFILVHFPEEFLTRFEKFNKDIIKGYYEQEVRKLFNVSNNNEARDRKGLWYLTNANFTNYVNVDKKWSDDTKQLLMYIKNAWFYCEALVCGYTVQYNAVNQTYYNSKRQWKNQYIMYSELLENISKMQATLDTMLEWTCYFIFYHINIGGHRNGNPDFRTLSIEEYLKMLLNYFDIDIDKELKENLVDFEDYIKYTDDSEYPFASSWKDILRKMIEAEKERIESERVPKKQKRKGTLPYFESENNIAKVLINTPRFKYKRFLFNKFRASLKNALFGQASFSEIFVDNNAFYYLDSPYFLTSQYDGYFGDELHKEMLDKLRGSAFRWLFSLQYFKGSVDKCSQDDYIRIIASSILIKDYNSYYAGFLSEFIGKDKNGKNILVKKKVKDTIVSRQLFEAGVDINNKYNGFLEYYLENKTLESVTNIISDTSLGINYDLYAILYRAGVDSKKEEKTEGREMFITNTNCNRIIPFDADLVQLPFEEFIRCAKADMDYFEIVSYASALREYEVRQYK